jgi:hypothetical protein
MNRQQQRQDARDQRRLEARKKMAQSGRRQSLPDLKPEKKAATTDVTPARGRSNRPPIRVIEERSFIDRWWKWIALGVVIVLLAVAFYVIDPLGQRKPLEGVKVASIGNLHVNPGDGHVPYNTDPPSSGPHFPTVPQRGIYTQPFVTEYLPHFLEHGGVDVTYNSSASPAVVQKLTDIVKADLDQNSGTDIGQVTLSPRPDMPCMVAVTSWGRIETWGTADGCTQQAGDKGHDFDPNNKSDVSALTAFIQRNQCQYDPENQCGNGAQGQTTYPTAAAGQPTVIASLGSATALPGQGMPQAPARSK